ncbi:hypothetical protein ACFOLF_29505 [Paenibacillus sepulcri]|uniref:Uncharacterized protein n=1 Tax=Paenibacillus sepulcri TaxID=359917 RepID=A0ABS7C0Z7_9BACL|nr:hypothetical protein [Paenibacillus sepulcri]
MIMDIRVAGLLGEAGDLSGFVHGEDRCRLSPAVVTNAIAILVSIEPQIISDSYGYMFVSLEPFEGMFMSLDRDTNIPSKLNASPSLYEAV